MLIGEDEGDGVGDGVGLDLCEAAYVSGSLLGLGCRGREREKMRSQIKSRRSSYIGV